jgi:hypothetical protein
MADSNYFFSGGSLCLIYLATKARKELTVRFTRRFSNPIEMWWS